MPASVHLVGLDVSAEALERNENLDEKMLGDIRRVEFPAGTFDAIICWTVMEHLPDPEDALRSFATWLRGGRWPRGRNAKSWSLKGLVTRLTPLAFHVWVMRRLFGNQEAGRPGVRYFKTYLRLSPSRLERVAPSLGFKVLYGRLYAGDAERLLSPPFRLAVEGISAVLAAITLRRWDPSLSESAFVLQKTTPVA